jgi:phosphosulfolactate phosphohydrolase-like enzyme
VLLSIIDSNRVSKDTIYVVVDTYKFSTTVTTALENGINEVYCTRNEDELEQYENMSDILAGGEVPRRKNQPVGNAPTLFDENQFEVEKVALTSDNGARRVWQLLDNGAENIILGCARNYDAVGQYLRDIENFVIVPADAGNTPRFEDYISSIMIQNVAEGVDYSESKENTHMEKIRWGRKDSESIDPPKIGIDFCLDSGSSNTVPEWNGEFFRRVEE